MPSPTYKPTTQLPLAAIDPNRMDRFLGRAPTLDAEQSALLRAFLKLPTAVQAALKADARSTGYITGAQVNAQGGDQYSSLEADGDLLKGEDFA